MKNVVKEKPMSVNNTGNFAHKIISCFVVVGMLKNDFKQRPLNYFKHHAVNVGWLDALHVIEISLKIFANGFFNVLFSAHADQWKSMTK